MWSYAEYKLIHTGQQYDRLHKLPSFKNHYIYDENWALLEMKKSSVPMNKPRLVFVIVEFIFMLQNDI